MTVIAWDGKTLAADKLSCNDGIRNTTTKIHRVDELLVGGAGAVSMCEAMIAWVRDGRRIEAFPISKSEPIDKGWVQFIVIERDGSLSAYDGEPTPGHFDAPYAIGSGAKAARMAMYLGLSASEAVLKTSELLNCCGNGVDSLQLG